MNPSRLPSISIILTGHNEESCIRDAIRSVFGQDSVSYTHLDVYKRQALVIAGAGSGKTRTLTYRVAWLLDHGTDPWNILLLTFTKMCIRDRLEGVLKRLQSIHQAVQS